VSSSRSWLRPIAGLWTEPPNVVPDSFQGGLDARMLLQL
jgi:hypothetical protein